MAAGLAGDGEVMSDTENVVEQLTSDQRAALKAGDKIRVATLRLLLSEINNRRIELGRPLTEDDAIEVFSRGLKQRREAEEQYRQGGRDELADREAAEAAIIAEYMPEPIDEDELAALIDAAVAETGATGPQDMGSVMGIVMPQVKGRVDGAVVSASVRERLA